MRERRGGLAWGGGRRGFERSVEWGGLSEERVEGVFGVFRLVGWIKG